MTTNHWVALLIIGLVLSLAGGGQPLAELLQFANGPADQAWSQNFIYYSPEYLERLRKEFQLDELVADAENDFERVIAVSTWVNGLWKHDGWNQPDKGDPISILEAVKQGERFRCVEYGTVITGCLQALGIPARSLGLKTADVETRESGAGHVVTEAFLRDQGQWVFIDGQWNAIPVLRGKPLNAVELHAALAKEPKRVKFVGLPAGQYQHYSRWVIGYLYYFDYGLSNGQRLMLGPVSAPQPTVFQRTGLIRNTVYTHSLEAFYSSPKI